MTSSRRAPRFSAADPVTVSPPIGGGAEVQELHARRYLVIVAAFSLLAAALLVLTYGDFIITASVIMAAGVLFITAYRLTWGFYLFVGCVLLFDQFIIPGFEPLTFKVAYFQNLKELSYLRDVTAAVVNPMELHLFLVITVWIVHVSIRRQVTTLVAVPVWGAAGAFFAAVIFSFVYGMSRGGDFLPALWEVRALVYFIILYFLTPQIIRTKSEIYALIAVCIGAISIKAVQGIIRFISLGFTFQGLPTLTSHEDAAFMVSMFLLLFALIANGARVPQLRALKFLALPLFLGFLTAQRRASYGALVPAFTMLFVLLPGAKRLAFAKVAVPLVLVVGLYVGVSWNSTSDFAAPVRLIKTGFSLDKEGAGERYYSNLYREFERYDLAVTTRQSPLLGIGFGQKYLMPIPLVPIPFGLRDYIPHNEILWLLVKTGAIGFFAFCLFMNAFIIRGAAVFTRLKDPYLLAVCTVIFGAMLTQVVVSYYDLQMTYYRNMVFLGVLMGLLRPLESLQGAAGEKTALRTVSVATFNDAMLPAVTQRMRAQQEKENER